VLLVFAGVSVVVGMFVIYNTFGILVAQRTRETALLRALGASGGQILRSVVVESLTIGFIGSVLGVVFGVVLAVLLKLAFSALGIDLPAGGIALPGRAIIVPIVVGVGTTLVSAVVPAYRSSRVPPLAAIQDVALDRSGRSVVRAIVGGILVVLGTLALVSGLTGGGVSLVGVAFLVVILAVAVIGPLFARPFARVIGAPLPATRGMTGTLARENASRNPKRTSATAMALTIGVAIVAFILVMATSIKASVASLVDKQFAADYVVQAKGFGPGFSPDLNQQLKQIPEVQATSALRFNQAKIAGSVRQVTAVEPDSITSVFNLGRISGDFSRLSGDGIAVSEQVAKNHNWVLGNTIHAVFVNTEKDLTVDAIYERDTVAGGYVIGLPTYQAGYNEQFDMVVLVKTKPGADQVAFRTSADNLLKSYPSAELQNQKEFKDSQAGQIDTLVVLIYVLLALAIIVALIGIGTTLALSVHERTRELGLLRAVGQFRGQTRGTIRWESAIVAVFGTLIGVVVGVAFGIAIVHALADQGFNVVSVPVTFLVVVVVIAGFAGVLASLWPASRAAKLDILNAIASE
jgi:putative ABC transport system permease protein